jgi:hypothetical protein
MKREEIMLMLVEMLARTPAMSEITVQGARLILAMRRWVLASRTGACPIAAAGQQLGSLRAGAHLHLLLEEIAAAWPDPFAVSPPCCRRLSHDEALLADMVVIAGHGDRPGFDRLLRELLPGDERERLFLSAGVLSRFL